MSAEARYFRVGLFVLLGLALVLAVVLVLAGSNLFRTPVLMETYFDEAVSGLEVGSPVKFRGVQIGQVSWVGFADDVYPAEADDLSRFRWIMVVMEIHPSREDDPILRVPEQVRVRRIQGLIDQGLRLRLATGVLTGTSFIQADLLDPGRNPLPEIDWQPTHLYVPSAPSTMTALSTAAERIFTRLEDVEVEEVVRNLDELLVALNERVRAVDVERLDARTSALLRDARRAVEQLDATLLSAQRVMEGGKHDLQAVLENLRVASENLRDVTDTARHYPSLLILGDPPKPSKEVSP